MRTVIESVLVSAIAKHIVGGIVLIVIGALGALFGAYRASSRESDGVLVALGGLVVLVIGVLLVSHVIHG
jgi:hypothetical protein